MFILTVRSMRGHTHVQMCTRHTHIPLIYGDRKWVKTLAVAVLTVGLFAFSRLIFFSRVAASDLCVA